MSIAKRLAALFLAAMLMAGLVGACDNGNDTRPGPGDGRNEPGPAH